MIDLLLVGAPMWGVAWWMMNREGFALDAPKAAVRAYRLATGGVTFVISLGFATVARRLLATIDSQWWPVLAVSGVLIVVAVAALAPLLRKRLGL